MRPAHGPSRDHARMCARLVVRSWSIDQSLDRSHAHDILQLGLLGLYILNLYVLYMHTYICQRRPAPAGCLYNTLPSAGPARRVVS